MSSSSMNRILLAISVSPAPALLQGQLDGEFRSLADLAIHADQAAVPLDDAVGHGQPEPRSLALALGGEKGLEDLAHVLLADAGARVGDGDDEHPEFRLG